MSKHVSLQTSLRIALIALVLLVLSGVAYGQSDGGEPGVLHNPLNQYGADP